MVEQLLPIDFGQGVDTKTDPKLVVPGKFLLLKDGIFTKAKQLTKRNGYDEMDMILVGGGSFYNPNMAASYKNELIVSGQNSSYINHLYSYSESLNAWRDCGEYNSVKVSKSVINASQLNQATGSVVDLPNYSANASCVVYNNIAMYVYEIPASPYGQYPLSAPSGVYITVVDLETGTHLCNQLLVSGISAFSKAALVAESEFAIFGISSISTNYYLYGSIVTINESGGVSIGSPVQIVQVGSSVNLSGVEFPFSYDVATTVNGCVVAAGNTGSGSQSMYVYVLNTALSSVHNTSFSTTGPIRPVGLQIDPSNNIWIYWGSDSGSSSAKFNYAIYSSTLSSVLSTTQIQAFANANYLLTQIAAINSSGGNQTVYYSVVTQMSANGTVTANTAYPNIYAAIVETNGTVLISEEVFFSLDIYARPFAYNGNYYMPCVSYSQSGATGVVLDLSQTNYVNQTSIPVAKFLPTEAEGIYEAGYGTAGGTLFGNNFVGIRYPGFINIVNPLSLTLPTQFLFAAGFVITLNESSETLASNASAFPLFITKAAQMGVCGITLDFENIDAYQSVVQQDTLVLNGGIVSMYDGAYVSELGFTLPPDNIGLTCATSGGSIGSGDYIYYVTYAWTDALGNEYESAPSPPVEAVFTTGSSNEVKLWIPVLGATQKQNVFINIYRSDSNLGGNIAYLIASLYNNQEDDYLTYTDGLASSTVGQITLYTENGAILDNIAPPPAMIMWTNNNRIWVVDSENPETTIEYSKTASSGTGISFSTGLLEYLIDSKGGPVTGVSPMDEKTVLLKQNGVGYFTGDGANDAGSGSTLTAFQFIPSDVGCTNSKSVILYPEGILFRTTKGIYQLSRGISVSYFGMPVEGYNSQNIQSALIMPSVNQIRFLTSNGFSLLYDYVMNQWSVFTNHTGYSATNWNGEYVYVRTDGTIYIEDDSSFLDNTTPFNLIAQTGWMNLSSVQAYQRVKELFMLGDYQNGNSSGHGIQIQAAYDFQPNYLNPVPYYFGAANSSGTFGSNGAFRYFMSRQKCDTISLLISEITTGTFGESIDLTNMSFLAGIKKGSNKLSPGNSVG